MAWKASDKQITAMRALARLESHPAVAARGVAAKTGQSTDGAAYTLRSLVRRNLVAIASHDGDAAGYRLTDVGRAEVQADDARQKADRDRLNAWLRERSADLLNPAPAPTTASPERR